MKEYNRVELNGVKVYPFTSAKELLDFVDERKGLLVAVNAEKVMKANEQTRSIINNNIGYADGAGVKVAMHKKGYKDVVRIAGCDLWLEIIRQSHQEKTFYLVGGKQEVIDETIGKLKKEFPGIKILGYRNGYIKTKEERTALIEDVVTKKPDVFLYRFLKQPQRFRREYYRLKFLLWLLIGKFK